MLVQRNWNSLHNLSKYTSSTMQQNKICNGIFLTYLFLLAHSSEAFSLIHCLRSLGKDARVVNGVVNMVNGDDMQIVDNIDLTAELDPDAIMPLAPPLTFDKYLTMQVSKYLGIFSFFYNSSSVSNF
jgi:hypothetical protein